MIFSGGEEPSRKNPVKEPKIRWDETRHVRAEAEKNSKNAAENSRRRKILLGGPFTRPGVNDYTLF